MCLTTSQWLLFGQHCKNTSQILFREKKVIPSLNLQMEGKPKPLVDHKEVVLQESYAQVVHSGGLRKQITSSFEMFSGFSKKKINKCVKASRKHKEKPKIKVCF